MKLKARHLAQAFSALALVAGFSGSGFAQVAATATSNDPYEILAWAPFKDGDGRVEIRRVIEEDGTRAVAIVRMASIGTHYEPRREWAGLPLAEQVNMAYEHLTGQMLTREAYRALQDVEEAKIRGAAAEETGLPLTTDAGFEPRSACEAVTTVDNGFHYDCKVYGPISRERNGVDDVCLLTAAIVGNHKMQISYRGTDDAYHENFSSEVTQGHFVASQLLTGVKRTRRGQIYKADNDEYSRYSFDGDFTLEGFFDPNVTQCQTITND